MKSLATQVLALLALAATVGGAANLTYGLLGKDSSAYDRHLQWWPRHYANATVVDGCEARAARQAGVATGSRGASEAPVEVGAPAAVREAPHEGTAPGTSGSEPQSVANPVPPEPDGGVAEDVEGETTLAQGDAGGGKVADARFPKIGLAEFREELLAGSLIIDARRTRAYVAGHVPGAISIPAWEHPGERINELLERGAVLEAPTVVYCTRSEECEDSVIVCGLLEQAGFLDLRIYNGGFPEWQENEPDAIATGEASGTLDPSTLQGDADE